MTSYVFQQIAKRGRAEGIDATTRQRDARAWFRNTAASLTRVNRSKMINDSDADNLESELGEGDIGSMFAFFYDPKNKKTLPYYDAFPLVIVIGPKGGNGFLGLNMHYLPLVLRARLMDRLYETLNNKKFDSTTKLKVNYELLNSASRFRYFEPCVKHYLLEHVRSRFLRIEPRFWDAALMLPTEKFEKASADRVWLESRSKVV